MHLALLHDGHPALLRVEGPAEGPVALFFHPFPTHADAWDEVLLACAREGIRAAALDAPGFGGSPALGTPLSMDRLASIGAAALDALGAKEAAIAGCSMGGYASMAFARLFPQRVRALALIATRASPDSPEGQKTRETQARAALEQGPRAVTEPIMAKLLSNAAPPPVRARVEALMARATAQGIADALRGMANRPDSHASLATLRVPALIVGAGADAIMTPDDDARLRAALPRAAHEWVADAGHLVFLEAADRVVPKVVQFLRRNLLA